MLLISDHVFTFVFLKLRHCEKATKFKKISLLFWRLLSKSADLSKQVGDFCGLFRKAELYVHWKNVDCQKFCHGLLGIVGKSTLS